MISDRRLYVTKDGAVVEEGSPDVDRLLVGAGCEIPGDLAKKHGLVLGPDGTVAVATDDVLADAEPVKEEPAKVEPSKVDPKPHRKP